MGKFFLAAVITPNVIGLFVSFMISFYSQSAMNLSFFWHFC